MPALTRQQTIEGHFLVANQGLQSPIYSLCDPCIWSNLLISVSLAVKSLLGVLYGMKSLTYSFIHSLFIHLLLLSYAGCFLWPRLVPELGVNE